MLLRWAKRLRPSSRLPIHSERRLRLRNWSSNRFRSGSIERRATEQRDNEHCRERHHDKGNNERKTGILETTGDAKVISKINAAAKLVSVRSYEELYILDLVVSIQSIGSVETLVTVFAAAGPITLKDISIAAGRATGVLASESQTYGYVSMTAPDLS